MCCMQKQAGSDDASVGFMFHWDFLVIVDVTEQRQRGVKLDCGCDESVWWQDTILYQKHFIYFTLLEKEKENQQSAVTLGGDCHLLAGGGSNCK